MVVSSHILTEVSHTADHVGIIAEGCLAYEDELAPGTDLEWLFMDVCRRVAVERRAAGEDGGMR